MGQRGAEDPGPHAATVHRGSRSAALLAIVLGYLVVAALFMGIVFPEEGTEVMAFRLAYAACTVVAAIGLWSQRRWAGMALAVWAGGALLCAVVLTQPLDPGAPLRQAAFVALFSGLLWLLYRYARRLPPARKDEQT